MTPDEQELDAMRYLGMLRVVPLSSGRIGVLDTGFNTIAIVGTLRDAQAVAALNALYRGFKRPPSRWRSAPSAPVARIVSDLGIEL